MVLKRLTLLAALATTCASAFAIEPGEAAPAVAGKRLDHEKGALPGSTPGGQVVYVDFWASWCIPCRKSMPALDALYRKHGAQGFSVVGVSKDVKEADARRFLERMSVGFPLVLDEEDRMARAFDVKAMPSGYLVDRHGVVRHVHRGFTDETAAQLETEIRSLLEEKR